MADIDLELISQTAIQAGDLAVVRRGSGPFSVALVQPGDVIGPASATDHALTRFDGTTGKLVQDSPVRLSDVGIFLMPAVTPPDTAIPGEMKFFVQNMAGRTLPSFIAPDGIASPLQPLLARKKIAYWNPPGNATTVPGVLGFATLTVTNFTATARNVATTNRFTRTPRIGYVTAATAGAIGNFRAPSGLYTLGNGTLGGFTFVIRFGISDAAAVSGARMFIGMRQSATPANVEPSTLTNCIGIGHGAADTNFKLFYGGSAAQTPIDLGVDFPANTSSVDMYELALFAPTASSVVNYEVTRLNTGHVATGTLSGTLGTQIPATTTFLAAPWGYRTNNATALAVGLDVAYMYAELDY